jgi:hypothetical protein
VLEVLEFGEVWPAKREIRESAERERERERDGFE